MSTPSVNQSSFADSLGNSSHQQTFVDILAETRHKQLLDSQENTRMIIRILFVFYVIYNYGFMALLWALLGVLLIGSSIRLIELITKSAYNNYQQYTIIYRNPTRVDAISPNWFTVVKK